MSQQQQNQFTTVPGQLGRNTDPAVQSATRQAEDRILGRQRTAAQSESGEPQSDLDVQVPEEQVRAAAERICTLNEASSDVVTRRAAQMLRRGIESAPGGMS